MTKCEVRRILVTAVLAACCSTALAAGRLEEDWAAFSQIVQDNYWRPADIDALKVTCEAAADLALSKPSSLQLSHEACVSAALRALDERTQYMTAAEAKEQSRERFVGIGLELSQPRTPGPIRIVQPIQGAPGERAGLLPGDDIYAIDGVDVTSLTLAQGVAVFRGEPGTKVTLRIRRGEAQEERTFVIQREAIRVRRARAAFLPAHRVLWLRISYFAKDSAVEAAQAIAQARSLSPAAPRKIILDLRGNPGGLLEEAAAAAALFLPPGSAVVKEHHRQGVTVRRTPERLDDKIAAILSPAVLRELRTAPITLLVDQRTGSGSEMVVMAVKESRGARITGQNTAGENTINEILPLPSGARVQLPIAKMSTPSGADWEGRGVPLEESSAYRSGEYGDLRVDLLLAHEVER